MYSIVAGTFFGRESKSFLSQYVYVSLEPSLDFTKSQKQTCICTRCQRSASLADFSQMYNVTYSKKKKLQKNHKERKRIFRRVKKKQLK